MSSNRSFENYNHDCNEEEERELEEALSLSDLPICSITLNGENDDVGGVKDEENKKEEESLDIDFDFSSGSQFGSISAVDGEMCAADEVFSGGLMLPYRNSVSSMSGLRSVSRSESMDRRTFGSRSSSSRSSSIRSHYSATSSGSSSSGSSNITAISAKTVPLVSKSSNKVVQNKFHSYPSPKPQILGTGPRFSAYAATSPIGKKSKMWDVLKLGLVRTPEIELQDLKLRHHRTTTNNFGKTFTIPRNNSTGSNSSSGSNKGNNNYNDRPRKSCDFVSEMQRRKNQLHEINNNNNGGFFKSCKCTIGVIEPIPTTPNYRSTSNKFGKGQVLNEDKNSAQKKQQQLQEQQQQQQQQRRNNQIRQGKKVTSHHHQQHNHHHHHRTFEWLKNLSHASILNNNSSIKF